MRRALLILLLCGCAGQTNAPLELAWLESLTGKYTIAFWQRNTDASSPIHIYIEGDGHSFDGHGRPTDDPTPRGTLVRDLAARDTSPNVAYLARPCQFIMSPACTVHDWTDGRFSAAIIDEISDIVRHIAMARPIVLIGYSGGAYVAAQIISRNPDLNVIQWVTVAGVLNHSDWTDYFGDAPLTRSLSLSELPRLPARHYVAAHDSVVPAALSRKWGGAENIIVIPGARHDKFPDLKIEFDG